MKRDQEQEMGGELRHNICRGVRSEDQFFDLNPAPIVNCWYLSVDLSCATSKIDLKP